MKRYQNPAIFEHLAMSYALGTLQGQARQRFETLQARHLYLRAVTHAYQQQFAPLAQLLPAEAPPARVWDKISRELRLDQGGHAPSPTWLATLKDYLPWSLTALASVMAAVITVLLLNLDTQPDGYMASLKSPAQPEKMMLAKVDHQRMEITFDMPKGALPSPKDTHMMPTLWCIPKDKAEKPMNMGALAEGSEHRMRIDKKTWQDLSHIEEFAISLEPMDQPSSDKPLGEVLFVGKLEAM